MLFTKNGYDFVCEANGIACGNMEFSSSFRNLVGIKFAGIDEFQFSRETKVFASQPIEVGLYHHQFDTVFK